MQTQQPAAASANAGTATFQPLGFRLPIAKGERFAKYDWIAKSACGNYEISIHNNHGHKLPGITHWGFESRIDAAGRRWTNTNTQFATDNFGNLVEVPA